MALQVNYDDLSNGKKNIEDQRTNFNNAFKTIYSKTEELVGKGYKTEDATAFLNQLKSYQAEFNNADQIIQDYANELEVIKAGFQKLETDLASQAKGIKV